MGTPLEEADARVAQVDEVLGGEPHPALILQDHGPDAARMHRVHEDDREAALHEALKILRAHVVADLHQHSVDPPLSDEARDRLLAFRHAFGAREQHHVAAPVRLLLHTAHELREDRVGEVGDDEPDDVRPGELESSCGEVRAVAEFPRCIMDALARVLADTSARCVAQHA